MQYHRTKACHQLQISTVRHCRGLRALSMPTDVNLSYSRMLNLPLPVVRLLAQSRPTRTMQLEESLLDTRRRSCRTSARRPFPPSGAGPLCAPLVQPIPTWYCSCASVCPGSALFKLPVCATARILPAPQATIFLHRKACPRLRHRRGLIDLLTVYISTLRRLPLNIPLTDQASGEPSCARRWSAVCSAQRA